jgi:hypothetical protein
MSRAAVPLWASAFVLAALLLVEAGRIPAAHAQMAASTPGGFTLVTAPSGRGGASSPSEFLYLLDGRSEILFVYEIPDVGERRAVFRTGVHLPTVFAAARGGG